MCQFKKQADGQISEVCSLYEQEHHQKVLVKIEDVLWSQSVAVKLPKGKIYVEFKAQLRQREQYAEQLGKYSESKVKQIETIEAKVD